MTVLLDKLSAQDDRDKYAAAAVEHGWSRDALCAAHQAAKTDVTNGTPSRGTDTARLLR
ncbi:hypothetical protein [Rhodococcus indonesiensis]|uniref:hypothetical protein n=1 Tax=Rhodococcus indonesiensis TaxID=3055869 RepID=UPI0039F6B031